MDQQARHEQQRATDDKLSLSNQAELHLELLNKVNDLQQQLALVNDNPLLGLPEAAELLAEHLRVDLVAIWTLIKDEQAPCSVLMASYGKGSSILQQHIVTRDTGASRLGSPCALTLHDASRAEEAGAVPSEMVHGPAALRSFSQIVIGTPNNPLGVLLLASCAAGAFEGAWWQVQSHLASTSLLQHLRHTQVERMAQLLRDMEEAEDALALIGVLLQGASTYMLKSCGMRTSSRLALLQHSPGAPSEALLFESRPSSSCASSEVVASYLGLSNTLLASAVAKKQARFISDCGQYMQTSVRPARDVFTRTSQLVSAIVVVPLIAGDEPPLGGLYLALSTPCEFTNVQDTLLGFIHGVTLMLHKKLAGQADLLAAEVQQANRRSSSLDVSGVEGGDAAMAVLRSSSISSSCSGDAAAAVVPGAGSSLVRQGSSIHTPTHSGRLPRLASSNRLNTEAMLQLLQQDLRCKSRRSRSDLGRGPEVVVGECLGRGGYGIVYKGSWHKVHVAVKVMPVRSCEHEAMQDAVEMAVLSSVQHPNVVSVYSCLTDMVEAGDANRSTSAVSLSGELKTRFRKLRPDEDPEGEASTFNIVVMEFCDRGTLRDAVKLGMFHRRLQGGAIGVDLAAAMEVLLDVAYAVQYLHSMQLVHGDIKMENILLKSDHLRRLGVTPKLGDFGLTRILSDTDQTINSKMAGTVNYLAPEMFRAGSQVTTSVDAYAFGILMYEVYTAKRAYHGLPKEVVVERVCKADLRPKFPAGAPRPYASLAEACWSSDPAQRPAFGQIAEALEGMLEQMAAAPPAAGAARG